MVSEKLDFLMKLTQTRNSTLGRALNFDPSYIGRIRTGRRGIPRHRPFLEPAAAYFARNLTGSFQRRSAADAVCPGLPWPDDPEEAAKLILRWFTDDRLSASPADTLSGGLCPAGAEQKAPASPLCPPLPGTEALLFYGHAGKREAVEAFLTPLADSGKPHTLLLYSDEDFSWLYDDPLFTRRWLALMLSVIRSGGHIRIIHTVARSIGEMLEAVQKWMPLYATGAIEPYYCPRLRDGIYHRTLFVAAGHCAVISDSVGERSEGKLSLLIRSPEAADALAEEFRDYLALCRPLMQIYTRDNPEGFFRFFGELLSGGGDLMYAGMLPAKGDSVVRMLNEGFRVTQLLHLPDPKALKNGEIALTLSDFTDSDDEICTPQILAPALRRVLTLLRTMPSYHVVLTERLPCDIVLCVREGAGVIFHRAAPPSTVFCIREANMTASFREYLFRLSVPMPDREQTVRELEQYTQTLENL